MVRGSFKRLLGLKKKDDGSVVQSDETSSAPSAAAGLISTSAPPAPVSKTSPLTTITVHQLPDHQAAPSGPRPPDPAPASPAAAPPSAGLTNPGTATPPPSNDISPWTRAYEIVRDREPELVAAYEKHLASLQGDEGDSAGWSIECVVNKLLEDREKRQWRVTLPRRDVNVRKQVERLAKFLLLSDPIVKAAVSTQPYAALAWSGVSLLLPVLASGTTQNEAMLEGFTSIGDLQVFWHVWEEIYLQPRHREHYQRLVEALAKLYSYIIEYQARVICHLSSAQRARAWSDVAGSNNWAGTKSKIDELDGRCRDIIGPLREEEAQKSRDSLVQKMQESCQIQNDMLQTMKDGRQDDKETQLLQDLAAAAGDYERYKTINPERVAGTCEWFLKDERFCKWRDGEASSLLWVSAGPGRGKSVLSRTLIDEEGQLTADVTTVSVTPSAVLTSTASPTVCYFFFKEGGDGRMDGARALCAMLHQLFKRPSTSGLIKHALEHHRAEGKTLTEKFSLLWQILVECAAASHTGDVICVLDALDECGEKDREDIINTLRAFYSKSDQPSRASSALKFLVTSRPEVDLKRNFGKFPAAIQYEYMHFDGDDKSDDIEREINLVIDYRIQELPDDFHPVVREKIYACLKSMENRTYLWLYLTFDIITHNVDDYGRVRDIEKLPSLLPSGVSQAYEKILDRGKDSTNTRRLLEIVLAAARPLTLDEAHYALTFAREDVRFDSHKELQKDLWQTDFKTVVERLCGQFVTVHDSKLSFIHQTAREFLTTTEPAPNTKWEECFSMPRSHSTISRCCLDYLLLGDLPTPVGDDSINDQEYPLIDYAAAYWPLHYTSQEAAVADQSRKRARKLCKVDGRQARIWAHRYLEKMFLNWGDWTDLALASFLCLKLVVQDILLEKADVDAQGGDFGTALQAASAGGHQEIVQMLLDNRADVDAQGGRFGTALQAASSKGHQNIVQILLDEGADVNRQLGYFGTALQAASAEGHQEIVQMLLDNRADVYAQGGFYGTALQAASSEGYQKIVQMLLDNRADVNAQGGHFGTALQAASAGGHQEIVQILLDKGADIDAQGGGFGTALQAASSEGHPKIVQTLLDEGADINTQLGYFDTALQAASAEGHQEIVQILLNRGAEVDAQGGHFGTALQAASERGHQVIVQMLLDKGADSSETD